MDADVRCGISSVSFSPYTREDVERFSVMAVTNEQTINHADEPVADGSYDPRLGASGNQATCGTCGKPEWKCNGHFGRVELSRPVYHPFYVKALKQLVSSICFSCFSTRLPRKITYQVTEALQLVARGQAVGHDVLSLMNDEEDMSQEASDEIERIIKAVQPIKPNSYTVALRAALVKAFWAKASAYRQCCANCQTTNSKVRFDKTSFSFVSEARQTPLEIAEVRSILDKFYENNRPFFNELFSDVGPSMFFLDSVCVTPTKFRPASYQRDKVSPHPSTRAIAEIVKAQKLLSKAIASEDRDAIRKEHMNLQDRVNAFFDKTLAKNSKKLPHGIRQILEKKEGLFRKNLMGKRVNFSARSVIAPDPYIATDEMGVPEIFAKTLSYPERVTEFNKDRLAQMVINGPERYPGANYIIGSDGTSYRLAGMDEAERKHRANMLYSKPDGPFPITVCRHVIDGDYVLINRQPTLHRVSILGMKCRVLPNQKTLRMHYSNCASFNADFDGDEINLHLPQNELGRSEVKNLSLSSIHYVTPTAGKPIRGLIQDHVDSGALLTLKDKFFTQAQYQQLVFAAFSNEPKGRIILMKPAIMLPYCLWTGKQVISTLLINLTRDNKPLNMEADSKFTELLMKASPEELVVRVCQSELVHGVIAKAQFGATDYGLVHCLFELYGSEVAGKFLTMLTRLFTFYMQTHGFTCGIDDMGITGRAEKIRRAMEKKMMRAAEVAADTFVREYGTKATEGLSTTEQLSTMLFKPNLKERFDCAMQSAFNEISKDIIKEIFPLRMLKTFPENCMIMMTQSGAKGSIVNVSQIACLLGQQALEGKRVPIMASGKTLPSFEPMDLSPIAGGFISSRFLTGLRPQEYYFHCMAGREGLVDTAVKTANTGYLQRCIIKHVEGIHVAYDGTVRNADDTVIQFLYGEDGIDPMNNRFLSKFEFMEKNYDAYIRKLHVRDMSDKIDTSADDEILRLKSEGQNSDPIQSIFPPHIHVGSVSEKFEEALNRHCNSEGHLIDPEKLRGIATLNYFRSIIQPGEAVGIVAAQAIGEPATQMTLNTFHLAGYGGTNVTLGIPRLKEVLVVATRSPVTPRMRIPLLTDSFDEAKAFVTQFNKVTLREVTKSYTVAEDFFTKSAQGRGRQITVELYLKHDKLEELHLATQTVACRIRANFSKALKRRIAAVFKSTGTKIQEVQDESFTKSKVGDGKEELSKHKDEELGADLQKIKSRKSEQNSYERDEDENQDSGKQEKQKEDEITDENIDATFDPSANKITVNYTVANISVKILLESIVEICLDEVMVHEVPGVSRAVVMRKLDDHNKVVVETEGCNLDAILSRTDVDLNRFYTNDIAQILNTYGIEAARTAIIREVSEVFKAYSISVDPRHLQLIADYVTQSGEWIGMSRHSMKMCASPIQQMSFETTVNFLSEASVHGATDTMGSPSASLTVGNVIKAGTGMCDILVPFE